MGDERPGSQRALRRSNARLILAALGSDGESSHAELARRTGLSRASITNIVRDLEASGRVRARAELRAGRNARVVSLAPREGLVGCVNVTRTQLRVTLGTLDREVVAEEVVRLEENQPSALGISTSVDVLRRQVAGAGAPFSQLRGVVVGVPGPLDARRGVIEPGSLMPRWVSLDLVAAYGERLGVPVVAENDANLGALGEFCFGGWGPDVQSLVYVGITSGVGAGLILGGRLHRGASGAAGEIGHTVVEPNGPLCRCGSRGCLETYVVAPTMRDLERVHPGSIRTMDDLIRVALEGEITGRRVIEDMARHLGTAVANLCNTVDPDVVVIAGPVTAVGDLLLEPVRATVERRAMPSAARAVRIEVAPLGLRAETLGGIALAADSFGEDPVGTVRPATPAVTS